MNLLLRCLKYRIPYNEQKIARREELNSYPIRGEYLEKLQHQAKLFEDKDIRVLSEPHSYYGPDLPF